MTIKGLENNYYLSGNDIWLTVDGFTEPVSVMGVTAANTTAGTQLPDIRMYPSPANEFSFNVCELVRALQPEPDHALPNSLQAYRLNFTVEFASGAIEARTEERYFIRGGRDKDGDAEWFLNDGDTLVVGRWLNWAGVSLPGYARMINGAALLEFYPEDALLLKNPGCDYKVVKYLNSLGAYQYFVFGSYEYRNKTKGGKPIARTSGRLRAENFRDTSNTDDRQLTLYARLPREAQEAFEDLVRSIDVYLYHPAGTDRAAKWQRLRNEGGEAGQSNFQRGYEGKAVFGLSNYYTREL